MVLNAVTSSFAAYVCNVDFIQEEDAKRREERERVQLERRYTLPDNPAILVHPNPQAKSGKFDCTVMSLSVLLDYRPEDNKEHSFEVSVTEFQHFTVDLSQMIINLGFMCEISF